VELPRFTIDNQAIGNQHDLQGVLQALGIRAAFDQHGFTKIYENGGDNQIKIVRQGAKIVVNEEGTEAGAATIVILQSALRSRSLCSARTAHSCFYCAMSRRARFCLRAFCASPKSRG
jgi:serine protease inhibitor